MAQQLIESLSADFDPTKFKDEYRERVLELIERKAAGEEIAVQPEAEDDGRRAGPDGRAGGQPGRDPVRRLRRAGAEEEPAAKSTGRQGLGEAATAVGEAHSRKPVAPRPRADRASGSDSHGC